MAETATITRLSVFMPVSALLVMSWCHARESGHPDLADVPWPWIPAYAGTTQR
jgi:hypothetical protein